MAINLTTPVYTEFEKDFFITQAFLELTSLNKGLFHVNEGVKNDSYTIPAVDGNVPLQAFASVPTSNGTFTLSDKIIYLGKFMGYVEMEPSIFENHWHVDQLSNDLLMRGLPVTFENWLTLRFTKKVLVPVENSIWIGSTTYGTSSNPGGINESNKYFDGILKQAIVGGTAAGYKILATASVVTQDNILAKMDLAIAAQLKELKANAGRYSWLKFIMSVGDSELFQNAMTAGNQFFYTVAEPGVLKYKGYEVVVLNGMPDSSIVFTKVGTDLESNLHLASTERVGASYDLNRLQANSTLWFLKLIEKIGVGVARPTEFVLHTTLTPASFSA